MDFISSIQLDVMLFLSGACAILAVMTLLARSLPTRPKVVLTAMETTAALLLLFDRFAYLYDGQPTAVAFYMVRISNGLLYFFQLFLPFLVTRCISDTLKNEAKVRQKPKLLYVCDAFFVAGCILLLIAPFLDLYYTIDAENRYHRAAPHVLCYLFPFLIVLLQETVLILYRRRLKPHFAKTVIVSIAFPTVAAIAQIFCYGLSLTNLTSAVIIIVFYTFSLRFTSQLAEQARSRELDSYKEVQKKESQMFEETTEALANAVDAKDKYTSGHSIRVAYYSRLIAREARIPETICQQIYFSALLHDVGKIGVPLEIINKVGKLTDEEYEQMKLHPVLGEEILKSIHQAPYLAVGARSHHERYDGKGYPDGLEGEDIPVIARIIAVADAYDAMTSYRSYRSPLSKQTVKDELRRGIGTQFDPTFARIMLRIMDDGYEDTKSVG